MASVKLKTDYFLKTNGVWKGSFSNFVNKKEGIIQHGVIFVEMRIDDEGIIHQRNAFVGPDGKKGPYEGVGIMKIEGNRLINPELWTEDPHNKNKIENYQFQGYIGENNIHILETYDEVTTEGETSTRRNSIHYFIQNETKVFMTADVYVNSDLFVFSSTHLILQE